VADWGSTTKMNSMAAASSSATTVGSRRTQANTNHAAQKTENGSSTILEGAPDGEGEGEKKSTEEDADDDDRVWVACNKCDKWRSLPPTVDMSSLPDIWTCDMNTYDPSRANCAAEEEKYVQDNAQLRSYFKIVVKRLKNVDRAETRLPPSAVTRGRKRALDVEWIRCSNPSCGKWRAIGLRGLDSGAMLKRLNRGNRWGSKKMEWFCAMNMWDESRASCVSPQEPLWDCPWNF